MIRHQIRLFEQVESNNINRHLDADREDTVKLDDINLYCDGLAQVIVPIIRTLYRGAVSVTS
jgi:hypothetical protein